MEKNSQRKIKPRSRFIMTGLTRRYFQQQLILNFFILLGVALVIMLSFLGVVRISLIENADDNLINKAQEIANINPMKSENFNSIDSGVNMYYIAYFDENNEFSETHGNIAGRTEKIYTELDDVDYDKPFRAKYANKEFRAIQVKLTTPENENWKVKVLVNISGSNTMMNSLMIATVILFSVSLVLLFIISYVMATMQVSPYSKAVMNSQEFTSNASHEINTPLTIIKTNLQNIMMQPEEKVSEVSGSIAVALSEIDRLQNLTKQLLMLSRSDDKRLRFNYEPINLKQLIENVCEPYSLIAEEQEKELKLTFEEGFDKPIPADKATITQILVALLDNEIKYTRSFMDISVKCGIHADDKYYISIMDNGDGVADSELENIFMRFYRSDKSRHSPGTGLGLSIVHALVKAMNGQIVAGNIRPHGLKITITLPIIKEKHNDIY